MKIERGLTSPARLIMENGVVLFEGTYTGCAQLVEGMLMHFGDATDQGYVASLESDVRNLQAKVDHLESLRPHWAEGHTDDSVAAQCKTDALNELWGLLGVSDQTMAMERLRELVADVPNDVYFHPHNANFYDATGRGMGGNFYTQWRHRADEFPVRYSVMGLAPPLDSPEPPVDSPLTFDGETMPPEPKVRG